MFINLKFSKYFLDEIMWFIENSEHMREHVQKNKIDGNNRNQKTREWMVVT